jgi:hypothetical protein
MARRREWAGAVHGWRKKVGGRRGSHEAEEKIF